MLILSNHNRIYQKRTIRPLYGTPVIMPMSEWLDKKEGRIILPGHVMTLRNGVVYPAHSLDIPYGICNNFVGGTMDDLGGTYEIGLWPLTTYCEVLMATVDGISVTDIVTFSKGDALYVDDYARITNKKGAFNIGEILDVFSGTTVDKLVVQFSGPTAVEEIVDDPLYGSITDELTEEMRRRTAQISKDEKDLTLMERWERYESEGRPLSDYLLRDLEDATSW